jgi:hypothetical protein
VAGQLDRHHGTAWDSYLAGVWLSLNLRWASLSKKFLEARYLGSSLPSEKVLRWHIEFRKPAGMMMGHVKNF